MVEIADDDNEDILYNKYKKLFRELLSSTEFEERMLMVGGPIERIYSKIVYSNSEKNEDVLALFQESDFILDYDFNLKLKNNASKRAIKMANNLLPNLDGSFPEEECTPKTLEEYMNSKVEPVIKASAGLEPGDFQHIFKEIRQELFKQGKNLVLLIEDITSCTGIHRDLLDALIIDHRGVNEKDKMCRLLSVVGTTTEYFKEFRSNYQNRITSIMTIEDGTIGKNTDDLVQFFAKYLNVLSISADTIDKWYKDGAHDSEYPIHVDSEVEKWEWYEYLGKKISLYPFTKRAIINLYNGMDVHKTPRHIIRTIIEPAVDGIIKEKEQFPKFLLSRISKMEHNSADRVKNTISNMSITNEEKTLLIDKVLAIMGYWGDGTLDTSKDGYLGRVSYNVLNEFGLSAFAEKIVGKTISGSSEEIIVEELPNEEIENIIIDEKQPTINRGYENFVQILSEWHYGKQKFTRAYKVRDEIKKLIIATIPWQQEGVPLISVQMVGKASYDLIEIERQDKNAGKGIIFLEDNDETYQLLLAVGKSVYLGKKAEKTRDKSIEYASWDFEGAGTSIRIVTKWIAKYKDIFVKAVKAFGENEKYPNYIKCSIVAEVYRSLLNGDAQVNKIEDFKPEMLLKSPELRKKHLNSGHSSKWEDLLTGILYANSACEENMDVVHKYFNLIQGTSANSSKKIINYNLLEDIFKDIRGIQFNVDIDGIENDEQVPARNNAKNYLKKILLRVDQVACEEYIEGKKLYESVLTYFGFPSGSEIEAVDIRELLNAVIDFYGDTEIYGINIPLRTNEAKQLRDRSVELAKAFGVLSADYSDMNTIDVLVAFSKDPMKIVKQFMAFIKMVDDDQKSVYNQMTAEKEALTRSGNWSDDVDPRFDERRSEFDMLVRQMES